jgi:Tfp pilus assembly protein PilN
MKKDDKPPSTEVKDQKSDQGATSGNTGDGGSTSGVRYAALAVLLPLLLCLGPMFWVDSQISNQKSRNDYLKKEIADAEQRMQELADYPSLKAKYLARTNVHSNLRADGRTSVVQLLGELSRRFPQGISLRSMQLQGDKLTLAGTALSGAAVEDLGGRLAESGLMASFAPVITQTEIEGGQVEFTLIQRVKFKTVLQGEGQ